MSAYHYAASSSPTLKTCNTPTLKRVVIHGNKYSCISPQPITEGITAVAKDPTRAGHAVTTVHQFFLHSSIQVRYIWFFFSKEKGIASRILRAHTPPHHRTKQLSSASALTRSQLSSARSFLSSHRKSSSVGPSYHACNCSLRDTSIHYPDSCHLPWQLSPVRLSFPFHILILTPEGLRQVPYRRS